MAYYYVKSGLGTRTSGAGTQQTGVFGSTGLLAADVYASIKTCADGNTITSADFICCSDLHDHDYATADLDVAVNAGATITSVDDTSADIYKAGARESNSTGDLGYNGAAGDSLVIKGVDTRSEDSVTFDSTSGAGVICEDLSLEPMYTGAASTEGLYCLVDGISIKLIDVTIPANSTSGAVFTVSRGTLWQWNGGSLTLGTNAYSYLGMALGAAGGTVEINGVDLSSGWDGTGVLNAVTAADDDVVTIRLNSCKLPSSWTLGERPLTAGSRIEVINCDSTDKHVSAYMDLLGDAITEETIVRTGGASIESQSVSFAINSTADARESVAPFRFKLATIRADFSSAKTLDIHVVHDDIIGGNAHTDDDELWIECYIPNASDPGMTYITSKASDLFNPSANAASTETWTTTGLTTPIKDKLSVTTDGLGGTGWAEIYLCLGKPSVEVFVCPKVEVS